MRWLFEKDDDGFILPGDQLLADAVVANGDSVEFITQDKSHLIPVVNINIEVPTIIRCGLKCRRVLSVLDIYPGAYYSVDDTKCTGYYPQLLNYLLNEDHVFIAAGCLKNTRYVDFLKTKFGEQVFIRPNDGDKKFTGGISYLSDGDLEYITQNPSIKDHDILLISSAKNTIDVEYRFVVYNKEIIASNCEETDRAAFYSYLQQILDSNCYKPRSPLYTIDICDDKTKLSIVELNSFSCAGLDGFPAAELQKVAKRVGEIVVQDFKDADDNV